MILFLKSVLLRYTFVITMFVAFVDANADSTKIGVILPLSGSLAELGTSLRDGFDFWKERHPGSNLEFVFEDDQFQPKLSVSAAQKLISIDKVAGIVTFTSGPGMVVAPLAERNHVPHFCLTVDSRLAAGDFNFVHLYQSRDAARRLLEKLKSEGITQIGIFRFIEDAAQLSASEIVKQAELFGITVSYETSFPAGTTDFRTLISAAAKKKAEVVVVIALPPELELLAKQMQQLRFSPKLTTIDIFSISAEPHLFDGLWYVTPAYADSEYLAAFLKRFKGNVGWAHYADNVATLFQAASLKSSEGVSLTSALMKLQDVPSTLGPISADAEGIFAVPVVISEMKAGVPVFVEK